MMVFVVVVVMAVDVDGDVVLFPDPDALEPSEEFGVAEEEPLPLPAFEARCRLTLWHDFPIDFSTVLPDEMSRLMRLQLYLDQPHLAN